MIVLVAKITKKTTISVEALKSPALISLEFSNLVNRKDFCIHLWIYLPGTSISRLYIVKKAASAALLLLDKESTSTWKSLSKGATTFLASCKRKMIENQIQLIFFHQFFVSWKM